MQERIYSKLAQTIVKRLGKVNYFLQAGNVSPNVVVHEIRKAFKRIRALLRFYYPEDSDFPRQASSYITDLGRQLSPLRNSWVNFQLFEKICSEHPHVAENKMRLVKEKLADKNKTLLQHRSIKGAGIPEFQEYELVLRRFVEERTLLNASDIGRQVKSSYEKAYSLFQEEGIWQDSERLHALRKRLKVLYYQVDFLKSLFPRYFKSKSDQLNTITELLGEEHDLFVLLEELKDPEYGFTLQEFGRIEKKINYLAELVRLKYQPRITQFFSEGTETFNKKVEAVFV